MNRNEQIEDMARVYEEARYRASETLGSMNEGAAKWYAKAFYEADYRKASEVAREIFAEIEKSICNIRYDVLSYRHTHIPIETMVEVCNWILQKCIPEKIAELKKKYTEVDENA